MTGTPGYFGRSPIISTNGVISFVFGQTTGKTEYNIEMECANQSTPLPNAWAAINQSGGAEYPVNSALISAALSMPSNGMNNLITITGLPCYNSNGTRIGTPSNPAKIGTPFAGAIFLNYTTTMCDPNVAQCQWHTTALGYIIGTRVVEQTAPVYR